VGEGARLSAPNHFDEPHHRNEKAYAAKACGNDAKDSKDSCPALGGTFIGYRYTQPAHDCRAGTKQRPGPPCERGDQGEPRSEWVDKAVRKANSKSLQENMGEVTGVLAPACFY
jgi:hypothetical protein